VNRAALVTGAGRRVGAAIAARLAERGFHVFIHVHRSRADGQALADALIARSLSSQVCACDLADGPALAAMAREVLACRADHYMLVNNASWFGHDLPGGASAQNLEASLDVHVRAPVALMEAFARGRAGARLDVVNVLDQKLGAPNPDYYSYTIGKHGLWGAARTWRAMQDKDVRVFGLWPGLMLTSDVLDDAAFKARRAANPLRRPIEVADLLRALDLVLDAPGLPGQDLRVDAGESLYARARDVAFEGEPIRTGG
jgi:NAD(P)-dependent dehydrogenase (short-subunit alcohol dehydrogenase family)